MTLTIEVRAKAEKSDELYQALVALLPTMREEPGCLGCRVTKGENGDTYSLTNEWEQKKNFENYMRSISGSALLGAIDLLGDSAKVKFDTSGWEDISVLKWIRQA